MTNQPTKQPKKRLNKVMGYLAIFGFAAGTLRAIQLEAGNGLGIVYVLGLVVVVYGLDAIFRLLNDR